MPEDLAFTRTASGLTRGLSHRDAFAIGLMFIQPIYAIWYAVLVGVGLFPGGNLLIALLISTVMCGIFGPLMWGILAGTMPRSGGEYIFNSRIINGPVALAASVANAFAGVYWAFVSATWLTKPSVAMLAQFLGWRSIARWADHSRWAALELGIGGLVLAFLVVAFGWGIYKRLQKPLLVVGIGGPVVLAFVLALTPKARFVHNWNVLAAHYGSLKYASFTAAVGHARGVRIPTTWNWHDTIGLMSALSVMFIYTYAIAYVSGEIKRPERSILFSGWWAVVITVVIAAATFAGLYRLLGFSFLSATAVNGLAGGVKGYTFPFQSTYLTLAWVASNSNPIVAWIAAVTFLLTSFWILVITYVVAGRAWFAWGMDRMGPRWFTDLSPRWATPVKNYAASLVLYASGLVVYQVWFTTQLSGLVGAGMQLVSVFLLTALSAVVLPFRRKTATLWESSPYHDWRVGRLPMSSLAGLVYMVYIAILLYFAFLDTRTREVNAKNLLFLAGAWLLGLLWYVFWRQHNRKDGIDVSVTYGQLPPE
jgi:APA family basic amino acid/polyamine antiporter